MGGQGLYRPRGSLVVAAGALCLALLSLGFGGRSAKPVSASRWVRAVCTAETTLQSGLASQVSAAKAATSGSALDPAVVKSTILNLLEAGAPAAQTLGSQLKSAGIPKIRNGMKIAGIYVSTAQSFARTFAADQPKVAAISTSDVAAFKATLGPIVNSLSNATKAADKKVKALLKDRKVAKALSDCGGVFALVKGGAASTPAAPGGSPPGGSPPAT